ncbi:hypothetical protein [Rhodoferax sp. BLA1]|uniref:hypothetical protein n=1 Tax=Rhodoferax sp. BLA1 TaxID=2576062 RepID=UPI0015D24935|nr:hypothetical protein [Rhodoferax sp. BLA1]
MIPKVRNQSDINLAVLNYVEERGRADYAELFKKFKDGGDNEDTCRARFNKKLEYLVSTEQLISWGRGCERTFGIGPYAGNPAASAAGVARAQKAVKSKKPDTRASATPAPLPFFINLSRLPASVLPSRTPPLRPGALDFLSRPSRGFAC